MLTEGSVRAARNNRAFGALPYNYEIKAPTTPAILHRGTELPLLVPNCEGVTNSCTSAPVCARNAGAAPLISDMPGDKYSFDIQMIRVLEEYDRRVNFLRQLLSRDRDPARIF